ncbi:MAG: hypothetical protein K1X57_12705 [Gemmataceae bacterium]|nr:hypothetical protein [Gemmataceae bacterium]
MNQFPPNIDELTARYLQRSGDETIPVGDVEAYDAVPAHAVDPRTAWESGLEASGDLADKTICKIPSGWSTLVAALESQTAVPMAAGSFPQAVRDWLPLIQNADLSKTLRTQEPVAEVAGLTTWVENLAKSGDPRNLILAAGVLRLSRRFDEAARLLEGVAPDIAGNELAALAWARGDHSGARSQWAKLPKTAATRFNCGMAELFLGDAVSARRELKAAADLLPENSGWHQLARLYLAVAETRG